MVNFLEKNCGAAFVIAIDGRAASGKSTLAMKLSELLGAAVIHVDDFFLPQEMRTEERLAEAGGNVHYERFAEEVLPHLKNQEKFEYSIYDCHEGKITGKRTIPEGNIRIVEGSYSTHPKFGEYADVKIFCDIDPENQIKRIINRNGEEMSHKFQEEWIPLEEAYFKTLNLDDYRIVTL